MKKHLSYKSQARVIAFVGIMAAIIECGKISLAFLPNIEVASLFVALFGYLFGWYGVAAAVVFVCIEPMIWGIGSWIITYAIYWPLLAFLFMVLAKASVKNRYLITLIAVGMTFAFGLISAVVDTAFLLGINSKFFANFLLYYLRGIAFYTIHIACNAVTFIFLFPYLSRKLRGLNITSIFRMKYKKL